MESIKNIFIKRIFLNMTKFVIFTMINKKRFGWGLIVYLKKSEFSDSDF